MGLNCRRSKFDSSQASYGQHSLGQTSMANCTCGKLARPTLPVANPIWYIAPTHGPMTTYPCIYEYPRRGWAALRACVASQQVPLFPFDVLLYSFSQTSTCCHERLRVCERYNLTARATILSVFISTRHPERSVKLCPASRLGRVATPTRIRHVHARCRDNPKCPHGENQ